MAGGTQSHLSDLPRRVEKVETHVDEQRRFNAQLTEGIWALKSMVEKSVGELSARIKIHDDRRAFWLKVAIGVMTAVALTLMGWIMKISYIVQTSKLP